jgi:NADH pyrophosphatase NudC (nudix superfamily)
MIVKEVSFSRTKSFGVYENVRVGAVSEVVYPGTEGQVLKELKEWVDAKISEEVSKPAIEMKTEELKQLESYIDHARKQLKAIEGEIKAKRRELDRCIELGMRSIFEDTESGLTCPHCNKLIFVRKPIPEGWSRFCPWCGEKIEEAR